MVRGVAAVDPVKGMDMSLPPKVGDAVLDGPNRGGPASKSDEGVASRVGRRHGGQVGDTVGDGGSAHGVIVVLGFLHAEAHLYLAFCHSNASNLRL